MSRFWQAHWMRYHSLISANSANPTPGSLPMLSLLILVFHLVIPGTAWPNQGTKQAIFKRIMKFDFPNFCPKCCRGNLQGLFYKDLLSSNPSTSEQNKKDGEGVYNASAISVHGPWGIVFFFFFFFLLIRPFNYFTAWPQLVWMLPEWPRQPHLKKVAFQH